MRTAGGQLRLRCRGAESRWRPPRVQSTARSLPRAPVVDERGQRPDLPAVELHQGVVSPHLRSAPSCTERVFSCTGPWASCGVVGVCELCTHLGVEALQALALEHDGRKGHEHDVADGPVRGLVNEHLQRTSGRARRNAGGPPPASTAGRARTVPHPQQPPLALPEVAQALSARDAIDDARLVRLLRCALSRAPEGPPLSCCSPF